jgi:hypothetical protein
MKNNPLPLPALWTAVVVALLLSLLLSLRTVSDLGRTTELWKKKGHDLQDMTAMRAIAAKHRSVLKQYAQYPASPASLGELARRAVPGLNLITRTTETHPSMPGWTARKVNIGLVDLTGDEFGRFLEAVTTATPPWAILDCTLTASPAQGRLAKVELILETAERN